MRFITLLIFVTLLFSCNNGENGLKNITGAGADYSDKYERAQDPWVFRSVLDKQPRMITFALNDNLWAAYSTQDCSLYKIWKGFTNLDGAVYTTAHGPQPNTVGNAWFINEHKNPWTVNGKSTNVQYKGHIFKDGQASLHYQLDLGNGKTADIYETPEYVNKEDGGKGFERVFRADNIPEGTQVGIKMNIGSIGGESSIETDGDWTMTSKKERIFGKLNGIDVDGNLILKNNGSTSMTTWFVGKPLFENNNKIEGAEDEEERPLGFRLIARSDCKSCHNTYRKTIGPAYLDVARRYDNTPDNVAMLVGKIKNGGAGVWGETVMTAHADLDDGTIGEMVDYIMSLDAAEEKVKLAKMEKVAKKELVFKDASGVKAEQLQLGVYSRFIKFEKDVTQLSDINFKQKPQYESIIPTIDIGDGDLTWAGDHFAFDFYGYIKIPKDNNYVFRLMSDDGSRLYIDGNEIIEHDGLHGADARDGEVALKEGFHPFQLKYFENGGGNSVKLMWKSFDDKGGFKVIAPDALYHHKGDQSPSLNSKASPIASATNIPGDGNPLVDVHPSYDLFQARPDGFTPKVGGIDFLSDGRMVVSCWDAIGGVYVLDGFLGDNPANITYKLIAKGFAEPLGLKVVNDDIYILQKQELTKLIDHDGDGIMDEYQTLCNAWEVSANFHEFAFGLEEKDGWLYGNLAIGIMPGGASATNQPIDRGRSFRVNIETGEIDFLTRGLRTPNGVGIGVDGEMFASDNQGDWLPASKIVHISKGAWYGSHAVAFDGLEKAVEKKPVVWLPQDDIGNSPGTPTYINDGPYKGQMIHSEITNGGVKRVFVEKVAGEYQGVVFRFIQGLESGINRLRWGPDGSLYVGGVGSSGNWGHAGKLWYGLQRLKYNEKSAFEMLAVRAKSNGIEIEFTEPLKSTDGWDVNDYEIKQWWYKPTAEYGGPKLDEEKLNVKSATVSADRKKVFLELNGMKENHVVYVQLKGNWVSTNGNGLWTTEAWYTMNKIPKNNAGTIAAAPAFVDNTLTNVEKEEGWQLMFNGENLEGWHNFRKETIGSSWKVQDGAIMLDVVQKPDGSRHATDGGDIVFEGEFQNFEFEIEWKIQSCGNSGVMYNVQENDKYDFPWMTGPEMQVLDNACHPDARIIKHKAGDLYDLVECKYITVKPAGEWNHARAVINNGKIEHWLNGHKVVETEMWTPAWDEMVKNSKWKDFPDFGKFKSGKIALQDHRDRVWFRNIKIRNLDKEM